MIGLEVAINGKRLLVAGLPEGAVSATVSIVQRRSARRLGRQKRRGSALLTVSGYVDTPTTHEVPWWVRPQAPPKLRIGDSVMECSPFRLLTVGT
jgi:hypothetical protein